MGEWQAVAGVSSTVAWAWINSAVHHGPLPRIPPNLYTPNHRDRLVDTVANPLPHEGNPLMAIDVNMTLPGDQAFHRHGQISSSPPLAAADPGSTVSGSPVLVSGSPRPLSISACYSTVSTVLVSATSTFQ